jgi:NAD(P)-dependent dehydrogenase (short-subunit alcohol dehydrogenase family)
MTQAAELVAVNPAPRAALVTGVGQSVGRGIAHGLAAQGTHVMCADRDAAVAERVRDEIVAAGGAADAAAVDVRRRADLDRVVDEIVTSHGRLDVMCNTDGMPGDGHPLAEVPEKVFDEVFEANFMGVLYGCQAAGRAMTRAGAGSIINVISATLDQSIAGSGAYAVANASVALITKVMAREVGAAQVRVNSIAITPIAGSAGSFDRLDEDPADAAAAGVLGRAGTPDDVAGLALYLASDASSYLTGQTIRLTGGRTMQW